MHVGHQGLYRLRLALSATLRRELTLKATAFAHAAVGPVIGLLLVLVAWGSSGFGSDEPVSYLHVGIVAVFGCLSGYWVLKKANATTRDFCLRVFEITWAVVVVGTLGWQAVGAAQSTLDPKINAGWNQIQEHGRLVATTSKRLLAALETRSAATNSADLASLPDWLSETARADAVGAFVHSMPPSRINAALTEAERELLDSIRWNQRRQTVVLLEVQQQEAIRKKLVFGREWTIYLFALAAAAGL